MDMTRFRVEERSTRNREAAAPPVAQKAVVELQSGRGVAQLPGMTCGTAPTSSRVAQLPGMTCGTAPTCCEENISRKVRDGA